MSLTKNQAAKVYQDIADILKKEPGLMAPDIFERLIPRYAISLTDIEQVLAEKLQGRSERGVLRYYLEEAHGGEVMAEEKKYTAEDLYIAFATARFFQGSQSGTMDESWKRNVAKGWSLVVEENRLGNRSGVRTGDFERQFNAAKKAIEDEARSGGPA